MVMDPQENDAHSGSERVRASITHSRPVDVEICQFCSLSPTQPVQKTFRSGEFMLSIDENDEMKDES